MKKTNNHSLHLRKVHLSKRMICSYPLFPFRLALQDNDHIKAHVGKILTKVVKNTKEVDEGNDHPFLIHFLVSHTGKGSEIHLYERMLTKRD